MRTVWKYELEHGKQKINMPEGAKILNVGNREEKGCLWAEVDSEKYRPSRLITVVDTGEEVPKDHEYVGTYQLSDRGNTVGGGAIVRHVFDGGSS